MKIEYRRLREGEEIRMTDEYDSCRDSMKDWPKWRAVPEHMVGRKARSSKYPGHTSYRREVGT